MKRTLLFDVITEMDEDLIAEYIESRYELLSTVQKRKFIPMNPKGLAALAVALVLIVSSLFLAMHSKMLQTAIGKPLPCGRYFRLGEACENEEWGGARHAIIFNEVYVTNSICGFRGNYIVFVGEIETKHFSFLTDTVDSLRLRLLMLEESQFAEQNITVFEKDLSQRLSNEKLVFDRDEGEMSGLFCLVFSIGDENFNLIRSKSPQTAYGKPASGASFYPQISLKIRANWSDGFAFFLFGTAEVEYVEEINMQINECSSTLRHCNAY